MTSNQYALTANKRTLTGKKTKQLRAQGLVPANIFGDVKESIAISVDPKAFRKIYAEAGENSVVQLTVDNEKTTRPVLIDELDIDPIRQELRHVTFRQVDLKEPVTAEVSVEVVGELDVLGATIVVVRDVIEVEALPTDLPESFIIDASKFTEIGQEVLAEQLDYDKTKVTLNIEMDEPIVQVQEEQQMVEEETPTPETVVEGKEGEEDADKKTEESAPEATT